MHPSSHTVLFLFYEMKCLLPMRERGGEEGVIVEREKRGYCQREGGRDCYRRRSTYLLFGFDAL